MAETMGITLEVQMAIVVPELTRDELEERLNNTMGINVDIEGIETYNPDMVTCTYIEEGVFPE